MDFEKVNEVGYLRVSKFGKNILLGDSFSERVFLVGVRENNGF